MKDQLSALIDGEFEIENAEHIIKSVKSGGELKKAWQHYHLIGDAMRGELNHSHGHMRHDFCEHLMQALEAEPTVLVANQNKAIEPTLDDQKTAKLTRIGNYKVWSVAASVAAVMFVGLVLLQSQSSPSANMAPVEIAQNVPLEYLQAHQAVAPSSAAYYIQNASFNPSEPQK